MPLLANKVYVLNKVKKDKKDNESILCHPLTSEVCESTQELERKTFLYNQNIWTCKITGQSNLTFKEAQKSEQGNSKLLKNSFMKCYEPMVLQHVHHSWENLENIIHKSWTQIHEEFSINEPVTIKITSPKQITLKGIVVKIDRSVPKTDDDSDALLIKMDVSNSDKENIKKKTIPLKKKYHYSVKLLEMDRIVNDIPSDTIDRTLRPPSKDQIRMFIRAHAIRHSGKASNPWVVDDDLVKKYKLTNSEPDFICDKAKVKEMSRQAEIQMYSKLRDDSPKKNGDVTVDLTLSDDEDDNKKTMNDAENIASKKLKQTTLIGMHNSSSTKTTQKIKSPFSSPSRAMPPLAQQLLRLMKENKDDSMVSQLILKCCQYSEQQIAKLPELIRLPIKDKKEKLEYKRKLKNMTPEEREAFMAERRVELRNLQREKRKVDGKMDDADMNLSGTIVDGASLVVDPSLTQQQWARIVSLSEFIRCFKGLLGPAGGESNGDMIIDDLCQAIIGYKNCDKAMFAELACLFLKPIIQDPKLKLRTELGVPLCDMPVTACTATELLRLVLPYKDDDDLEREAANSVDNEAAGNAAVAAVIASLTVKVPKTTSDIHNNMIALPICEKLASCELDALSVEDKVAVLELLRERILELEIIGSFIDECQRESSEAYKRRLTETKDLNDRLREIRIEMADMSKMIADFDEASQAALAAEEAKMGDDMPTFARRRMSLEVRNKEQEDREKRLDMDRQLQKLERDENACRRSLDQANQTYNTVVGDTKQLLRVQPLGSDRLFRRYWLFRTAPGILYVEREVTTDGTWKLGEYPDIEWKVLATVEEVERLIAGLDERGIRENALKKELQASLPRIRTEMNTAMKRACEYVPVKDASTNGETVVTTTKESSNESTDPMTEGSDESFLVAGFKDELRETEINIRQGSLGGVEDYDEWNLLLDNHTDLAHMKEALVSVFIGVHERFWNSPLKSEGARSAYLSAITDARTQSRLNILQCFLDVCVCWNKSASDDKCRVCHKNHKENTMLLCDSCNRAYHTFCLRPPLRKVPDGEWLCPDCKVPSKLNGGVGVNTRSQGCLEEEPVEEDEEEAADEDVDDESEEDEEELCCVCQVADEGLGKCVQCGSLYHGECHDPPMRHMPRTGWTCGTCARKKKTRAAKTAPRKSSLRSAVVDDDSEDEDKPPKKVKKRTATVNGKRKVGESAKDNDDDDDDNHRRGSRRRTRQTEESDGTESPVVTVAKKPANVRKRASMLRPATDTVKRTKTTADNSEIDKCVKALLKQLIGHKSSWPFRDRVDESEVPDYYSIVSDPIDLAIITDRHKDGQYVGMDGLRSFLADVALLFANADQYNEPETPTALLALELEASFKVAYDKYDLGVDYDRCPSTRSK